MTVSPKLFFSDFPVVNQDSVFSNTFCYLCNLPSLQTDEPLCSKLTYNYTFKSDTGPVFDLLVDPGDIEPMPGFTPSEKDSECPDDYVFDPYTVSICTMKKCIHMYSQNFLYRLSK